jgi:hypothetical protein
VKLQTEVCLLTENWFQVVCFLLGNSPASEFYMPTFQNTLSHREESIQHSEHGKSLKSGDFRLSPIQLKALYLIIDVCNFWVQYILS